MNYCWYSLIWEARAYRGAQLATYAQDLQARLKSLPHVAATTTVTGAPFVAAGGDTRVQVPGYSPAADDNYFVSTNSVGADFVATAGIRIVQGRTFDGTEETLDGTAADAATRRVAIVNEAFTRKYFGARDPVGQHIYVARAPVEIVGVAENARLHNLRDEPAPVVYLPVAQDLSRWRRLMILVRSDDTRELTRLAPAGACAWPASTR